MPTLQSINLHPELRKKLQEEVEPPIRSPLAILSRDPATQILEGVPLHLWDNIRSSVADALLLASPKASNVIHLQEEESSSLIVGSFTALEYQRHLKSKCSNYHPLTTNCQTMDRWCQPTEGLPMLIQFTGPHGSGKTQVCLSLAISHIRGESSTRGRVYYLLSSNMSPNPIARRLRQFAFSRTDDVQQVQAILDRIELISATTPHEVLYALQQLVEDQEEGNNSNNSESILLLFDSVSGCLSGCNDWNLIQQISLKLKELVRWHGIQIVLTNGVVSNDKAALGQIWTHVADVDIRMDINNNATTTGANNHNGSKGIRATLERHPTLQPTNESVDFLLTAWGIEPCQYTTQVETPNLS